MPATSRQSAIVCYLAPTGISDLIHRHIHSYTHLPPGLVSLYISCTVHSSLAITGTTNTHSKRQRHPVNNSKQPWRTKLPSSTRLSQQKSTQSSEILRAISSVRNLCKSKCSLYFYFSHHSCSTCGCMCMCACVCVDITFTRLLWNRKTNKSLLCHLHSAKPKGGPSSIQINRRIHFPTTVSNLQPSVLSRSSTIRGRHSQKGRIRLPRPHQETETRFR